MTTPEFELHLPFPTSTLSPIELRQSGPARLRVTVDAPYTARATGVDAQRASYEDSALWLYIHVPTGNGENDYPLKIYDASDEPVAATTVRVTLRGKGDGLFTADTPLEVKPRQPSRESPATVPMTMDGE